MGGRESGASPADPLRSHYGLNHPAFPPPHQWKNCLPRNRVLVPKRLGTAAIEDYQAVKASKSHSKSVGLHKENHALTLMLSILRSPQMGSGFSLTGLKLDLSRVPGPNM